MTAPTDAEMRRARVQRYSRGNQIEIEAGRKFAVVLLKLHPDVTSADYSTLGTAVNAVTGIQGVSLLIDGQVPDSEGENETYYLHANAHLGITITEPEPEP